MENLKWLDENVWWIMTLFVALCVAILYLWFKINRLQKKLIIPEANITVIRPGAVYIHSGSEFAICPSCSQVIHKNFCGHCGVDKNGNTASADSSAPLPLEKNSDNVN